MKINPIWKREMTVSARSFRTPLILTLFNSVLALVALLNMYSTISQVKMTAEIQYTNFLSLYMFVSAIEFVLLVFIMPALTSGSISGERERQTLDLMMTTQMTPSDIVWGKLLSSFHMIFLLVVSSFPMIALLFVYGSITEKDLILLILCYITSAMLTGSIGICASALFKRSTLATVASYGMIIVIMAGTYAVNRFAASMSAMNHAAGYYANAAEIAAQQPGSGGFLYTLLINPAITFLMLMNRQTGTDMSYEITSWFQAHGGNVILDHWIGCSLAVQLMASALFIWLAARALQRR